LPAVASIVALVIAGGVLVLVRHGSTATGSPSASEARGLILDASGAALVKNRVVFELQIDPAELSAAGAARTTEYRLLFGPHALARLARCDAPGQHPQSRAGTECELAARQGRSGIVTLASDVSLRLRAFVGDHRRELPGVRITRRYVAVYPFGSLAAQVLGTLGPINAAQTHETRYQGVPETAIIGQSGLESEYDRYLRAGQNLTTTLDTQLERTGSHALQQAIDLNQAKGGAFVAMNPDNGQIYGMGSLPTFNPTIFTKPLSQSTYAQLNNPSTGYPLIDRVTQSAGPTGSTFTPITAIAALESGDWLANDTYDDTGEFCIPSTSDCLHNSGHTTYGTINLPNALRVDDLVFFYHLGAVTNVDRANGGPLQRWAEAFGIGQQTGVDLPSETAGTLPSPAWNAARNKLETECENATGQFNGRLRHPASAGGCGIAVSPLQPWTTADNVNMAVGQGDLQVTPLQLAVAYAALANGGTIVTPHLGLNIQTPAGNIVRTINPPPKRHLNINPLYRQRILEGLRQAASATAGTSDDVFGDFPEQVYGKTGTAQYISNGTEQNYAWYACFVPATATSKPIVVVVWVEQGGFGAVAAAPVAREILSQWFLDKPGRYQAGASATL
jgi:penicillin-binding protein 2